MSSTLVDRISHEREFHNQLEREPLSYRMVRIASEIFYNKDEGRSAMGPRLAVTGPRGQDGPGLRVWVGRLSLRARASRRTGVRQRHFRIPDLPRARGECRHNVAVEFSVGDAHYTGFHRQPSITFLAMAFCTTSTWIRPTGKLPAF